MLFKDMAGKTDSKVVDETGPISGTQSVPGQGEADESDSKVVDEARLISETQSMRSKDKTGKADSKDVDEAHFLLETHSMSWTMYQLCRRKIFIFCRSCRLHHRFYLRGGDKDKNE